jgi:hypothetical protein
MTKFIVLVPILASCSVGTYGESGDNSGDDMPMTDDRDTCVTRLATPAVAHNHTALGAGDTPSTAAGSRKGVGCMAAAGCHGAAPGSTAYTIAGTAYKEMPPGAPTAPAAGATIRLFMPGTKKSIAKTVTDADGNFYTSAVITFPAAGLEVDITDCSSTPNIQPMIAPIRANEGNCASSDSCHIVPGPRQVFITGG